MVVVLGIAKESEPSVPGNDGLFYGKYRAFVRDNNDPERLGRVRMEIPAVLGTGEANWSDWAWPCLPYGGNDDTGMFLIPDEGASVWAEFEGGQPQYPIWSGVWLAKSNPGEQPSESARTCATAECKDCEDKADHQSNPQDNAEHRKYHGHPPYYCPRMRVLFKSETGHTIYADDKDGNEIFKFLDRSGQGLEFSGAVKPSVQQGNSRRRGTADATTGTGLSLASDMVDKKAHIALVDLSKQKILLEAWQDQEKVHILSGNSGGSRWQKILLDTTKGREKLTLFGLGGNQTIVIDSAKAKEQIVLTDKAGQSVVMSAAPGRESITLTDKAGSTIKMDGLAGMIQIKSTAQVLINT